MTCPHCKNELPEDSKFCQYCGASFVGDDGTKNEQPTEEKTKGEESKKKEPVKSKKPRVWIAILAVVSVLLAALNGFQYFYVQKNLEQRLTEARSDYSSLWSSYSKVESENKTLQEQADRGKSFLTKLKTAIGSGTYGSNSSHFNVDSYVVLVNKNGTKRISMTAFWNYRGTVSVKSSAPQVATATFDQDSWSNSTTMTIRGWDEPGVARIHFSNDMDKIEFYVLVIVLD